MNSNTTIPLGNSSTGSNDNDEFHALVKPNRKREEKSSEGLLQRLMLEIDKHMSCKLLVRIWGPRVGFIVRLMLVSTFLDDTFRTLIHFSGEASQIGDSGWLKWLNAISPFLTMIVLAVCLLAQFIGSLCILALIRPKFATQVLIGCAIAQPMLNGQLSNFDFVAESLTLIGGLLMLHAHVTIEKANDGIVARTQMVGRMLLPAAYLYKAGVFFSSAFTLDETSSLGMYFSSLSMCVINTALLIGLLIGSALVAIGLKSRCVAFFLALANIAFVCYEHPFFLYVWREGGEWKYDEFMPVPNAAGIPEGYNAHDFELSQLYDLHVYYFFLGLSTSGALLLLTQFGPGEISIQKDEVLLPKVRRAED